VPENSVTIGFFVLHMEKRQQFYQNKTAPKHTVPTKTITSLQTCRSGDRKRSFNKGDGLAVTFPVTAQQSVLNYCTRNQPSCLHSRAYEYALLTRSAKNPGRQFATATRVCTEPIICGSSSKELVSLLEHREMLRCKLHLWKICAPLPLTLP